MKRFIFLLIVVLSLLVSPSLNAIGIAPPRVSTLTAQSFFRPGTSSIDFIALVASEGQVISLTADAQCMFVTCTSGVIISKISPELFSIKLPLDGPLTGNGTVSISVTAIDNIGQTSAPRVFVFSPEYIPPTIDGLTATITDGSNLTVSVDSTDNQALAFAQFRVLAVSAELLREADGVIDVVRPKATVLADNLSVLSTSQFRNRFSALLPVVGIDPDTVFIIDSVVFDLCGNSSSQTSIQYSSQTVQRSVVRLTTLSNTITLGGIAQSAEVVVKGELSDGSVVDLTGLVNGTQYLSSAPDIAAVSPSGIVTAISTGQTEITVTNGDQSVLVTVLVEQNLQVSGLQFATQSTTITGRGETVHDPLLAGLACTGSSSCNFLSDVSGYYQGATYSTNHPEIVSIDRNGYITGRALGTATVFGYFPSPTTQWSAALLVEVVDSPPQVEISLPSLASPGSTIDVFAQALDDSRVTSITLVVNGNPVQTISSAPFHFQLAVPSGLSSLAVSAIATDEDGISGTSATHSLPIIQSATTEAIVPTLVSPVEGDSLIAGIPVLFRVKVDNLISYVEFKVDNSTIARSVFAVPNMVRAEDESVPHQVGWNYDYYFVPLAKDVGRSIIVSGTAVGSGVAGDVESRIIRIIADQSPTINISNVPASIVAGKDLPVSVNVFDDTILYGMTVTVSVFDDKDVLVATSTQNLPRQEVYLTDQGTTLIANTASRSGSRSFSFSLPIGQPFAGKTLKVLAKAIDVGGNLQLSPTLSVNVSSDHPPTALITSPIPGSTLTAGQNANITVQAVDDVGISNVILSVDGTAIATLSATPYSFRYQVPVEKKGKTVTFRVKASDTKNQQGYSQFVTVNVIGDTQIPNLAIVQPYDLSVARVTSSLPIILNAYDNVGIAKLEIFANTGNGATVAYTDSTPKSLFDVLGTVSTSYVLPSAGLAINVPVQIWGRATDLSGNVNTSRSVFITPVADRYPTVFFGSDQTTVTVGVPIVISANAQDDVSVSRVQLEKLNVSTANWEVLAVKSFVPWQFPVTATAGDLQAGLDTGTLSLRLRAWDSANQSVTSAVKNLLVMQDAQPPQVQLTQPKTGGYYFAGRPLDVEVLARDNVAVTCVKVNGSNCLTRATTSGMFGVYRYRVATHLGDSTAHITATATDSMGNLGSGSEDISLHVDEPPTAHFEYPTPSGAFYEGELIPAQVEFLDDSVISQVVPLSGGNLQTSLGGFPTGVMQTITIPAPLIGQTPQIGVRVYDDAVPVNLSAVVNLPLTVIPDVENPVVSIVSPTLTSVSPGARVHFKFLATDNVRTAQAWLQTENGATLPASLTSTSQQTSTIADPVNFGQIVTRKTTTNTFELDFDVSKTAHGTLTFTAFARDPAGGLSSSVPIALNVVPDTTPPTVTISPSASTLVENTAIDFTVTAVDNVGLAGSPSLLVNSVPLKLNGNTARFMVPMFNGAGQVVTVKASAMDSAGNLGTITRTYAVVNDTSPIVSLSQPVPGPTLTEGASVSQSVSLSDDVGIKKIVESISTLTLVDANKDSLTYTLPVAPLGITSVAISAGTKTLLAHTIDGKLNIEHGGYLPAGSPLTIIPNPSSTSQIYRFHVRYEFSVNSPLASTFLHNYPSGETWATGSSLLVPITAPGVNIVGISVDWDFQNPTNVNTVSGFRFDTDGFEEFRIASNDLVRVAIPAVTYTGPNQSIVGLPSLRVPDQAALHTLQIKMVAVDTADKVGISSDKAFGVTADLTPPFVGNLNLRTIQGIPFDGQFVYAGQMVALSTSASDNVSVSKVQVLENGASLASAQYVRTPSLVFDVAPFLVPSNMSEIRFAAQVTDRSGLSIVSAWTSPDFLDTLPV